MHKVTCGSVSDSCLGSNNRSSVPISGGRVPGDLAPPCDWLDRHCEKFTLEGAPQFLLFFFLLSFQLNVECSTLKGHSECVKICACVCVCLFSPHASLFSLSFVPILQRSLNENQATSWDGTLDPLLFYLCLLSWPFKIREGYKKIIIIQCQKSHAWNNPRESSAFLPRGSVEGRTPNVSVMWSVQTQEALKNCTY